MSVAEQAAQARRDLAQRVRKRDDFAQPLRRVAGFDAALDDDGGIARAAVVLLDADTLEVLDRRVAHAPGGVVDVLLQALAQLSRRPDLAFVRGHGIAHPQRLGIASHFGVAADLPSIGVATDALLGTAAALHEIRGAHTPLRDGREHVGWLLRTRPGDLPLVVSPGHRVSMTAAAQLVMRYIADDRLPEPIRLAAALAAGRDPGLPVA